MASRSLRSWAVSALVCWLVLLASADDFNLVRLALPSSLVDSEGLLPSDDPNSDFTPTSQSREPSTTSGHRCSCTRSVGPTLTLAVLPTPLAARTLGHPLRPGSNTPLRC
jgi:hypothetical protein